jgi:hypothetical protein
MQLYKGGWPFDYHPPSNSWVVNKNSRLFKGIQGFWSPNASKRHLRELIHNSEASSQTTTLYDTKKKRGKVADLDGTGRFLADSDFPDYFDFNSPFSVSAWVYQDSSSGDRCFFSNWVFGDAPANHGLFLQVSATDKLRFTYRDTGVNVFDVTQNNNTFPVAEWVNVLAVYDPSLSSGNAHIFQNGIKQSVTMVTLAM